MKRVLAVTLLMSALVWAQAPRKAAAKKAAAPSKAPYQMLQYPQLKPVKIPDVATFTLPNGMKLYLLENHELPLISGTALVRTGNLFEPSDKVGLAGITGSVMRTGGTAKKTGDQLDVELENRAASVEAGIGETSGNVSFSTLKENLDQVLPIFHDVLTNPEFRQDKLDLLKSQMRSSISRRNDSPDGIASREFEELMYGRQTPYGRRMEYAHLENIQRADLMAFYRRYFFPGNVMLAVQGDFNTAEMKARLEALFADWNVKQEPVPAFPKVDAPAMPGVYVAEKSDINQTFFRIGHLGGQLNDKDYPALEVMADILGGSFGSRLFSKVRTEMGLAYSVGARWSAAYDHPGVFRISGSTKTASTVDAIQAIQAEVARIRTAEVTDQELRTAKDTVLNGLVFAFDRPSKTLGRMMNYEYFGYPKDFLKQYQAGVDSVTKADVLRVAQKYLKPESFTILAVTNPKDLGKPLDSVGAVKKIDLTIPPPPAPPAAKADPAAQEKGKKLLAKLQQALGGAGKLAAVKDLEQSTNVAMTMGGMKSAQKTQYVAPSHFRQEQVLPFGKIMVYSDGETGWLNSPQGLMAMPAPVVRQVQNEMLRMWFNLAMLDRAKGKVAAVDDNTIELTDARGEVVRVQMDATGLPAKTTYASMQMGGAPSKVEETYSDFREVGGIKLPFKIVITQSGQKFAEATVESIKLNQGLKIEDLAKKP